MNNKLKLLLTVISISTVSACTSTSNNNNQYRAPTAASEAMIERANQQLYACLLAQSTKLDDGISDVHSVALTVVGVCRTKSNNYFSTLIRGAGPLDKSKLRSALKDRNIEATKYFILSSRAET